MWIYSSTCLQRPILYLDQLCPDIVSVLLPEEQPNETTIVCKVTMYMAGIRRSHRVAETGTIVHLVILNHTQSALVST